MPQHHLGTAFRNSLQLGLVFQNHLFYKFQRFLHMQKIIIFIAIIMDLMVKPEVSFVFVHPSSVIAVFFFLRGINELGSARPRLVQAQTLILLLNFMSGLGRNELM